MRHLAFTILLFFSFHSAAQVKHDYVWLFGTFGPGEPNNPDTRFGMNIFDFNNSEANLYKEFMDVEFFATNSSICNNDGQLLFFSNGCKVFNADFEVMENGSGLNPGTAYSTNNCPDGGNSIANGLLILPLPNNENIYYIFHLSNEAGTGVYNPHTAKLYYSKVDMSMNNSLGAVVEKNQTVIADTLSIAMHAVKHDNGTDWWVFTGKAHKDEYFSVLFTENGIEEVNLQENIGGIPDQFGNGGIQGCFSPDGSMYARYVAGQSIYLFDFDRSNGELFNYREMFFVDTIPSYDFGGVAFSSNNRFLYMCNTRNLWQFDLQAANVQASRTHIAEYDGYEYLDFAKTYFFNMRLAPDCKIYMPSLNASDILHVIHNPNKKGTACNFIQHELKLPAVNFASIPNFPNYRLGTGYPVCDSTIQLVTNSTSLQAPNTKVMVWPNPASGQVSVKLPYLVKGKAVWRLFNQVGQLVETKELARGQLQSDIDLGQRQGGLYLWEVISENGRLDRGRLVISKNK